MQIAKINFNDGKIIKVQLMPEHAPISVANFVELAKKGYYNNLIFHRVIPNFMIQGGGMDETMDEPRAKVKAIKGEFKSNGVANSLTHTAGTISMARTMVKDSATSQFFICVADVPHLDGEYAAFGRTIDEDSLKTAIEISKVRTGRLGYYSDVPCEPIIIKNIEIIEE